MRKRLINARFVQEDATWWADSTDLPGLSVTADSAEELRKQVRAAVSFALDDEPFELVEVETRSNALTQQ